MSASAVIEMAKPLPFEQLEATKEYGRLTARQRMYVRVRVETGDPMLAVRTAYDCKSDHHFRIMTYEVAGSKKVQAALRRAYGETERETFINQLQKRIDDRSITIAEWKAANLLCRLKGWKGCPTSPSKAEPDNFETPTAAEAPEHVYRVGQIVLQNDCRYRVTAVDASGKITAAEPVTE